MGDDAVLFLIGGFVLGKKSLDFIEFFQPTADKTFSFERGLALAYAVSCHLKPGEFVTCW